MYVAESWIKFGAIELKMKRAKVWACKTVCWPIQYAQVKSGWQDNKGWLNGQYFTVLRYWIDVQSTSILRVFACYLRCCASYPSFSLLMPVASNVFIWYSLICNTGFAAIPLEDSAWCCVHYVASGILWRASSWIYCIPVERTWAIWGILSWGQCLMLCSLGGFRHLMAGIFQDILHVCGANMSHIPNIVLALSSHIPVTQTKS